MGRELFATASIGVVMNEALHEGATDLLRYADVAMYRAKNSVERITKYSTQA